MVLLKMDLLSLTVVVSILSAALMMVAIIYILTYVVGAFSSRSPVMSLKFVLSSLIYFFGSTIFLLIGSEWVSALARVPTDGMPFFLNVGASALAFAALLHVSCGFLAAFMYLRDRFRARPKL
jgi:hypothetical protein